MCAHITELKVSIQGVLVALVFCLGSSTAIAGELLVARSNDARHVVGSIIDGDEPLHVDDGKSVTLIARDGRKLRIRGPSHAAPDVGRDSRDGSLFTALSRLLSPSGTSNTVAVFRGAPQNRVAQVITLDAEQPRCISKSPPTLFVRPDGSNADELMIARADGPSVSVMWPDARSELDWPPTMAYLHNTEYTVSLTGQADGLSLRLFTLPQGLPSRAHAVAWMADMGCDEDARRELREMIR